MSADAMLRTCSVTPCHAPARLVRRVVAMHLFALAARQPSFALVTDVHDMCGGTTFERLVQRYVRGGRKGRAAIRKLGLLERAAKRHHDVMTRRRAALRQGESR